MGNKQSDLLAKQGATKAQDNALDLKIPTEFNLQGVKLASLTQATAYRGIKECKPPTNRELTERNLQLTAEAILEFTSSRETEAAIWQGIR